MAQTDTHLPSGIRGGYSLKDAVNWSGLSRSSLYRAAAEGKLVMRKCGRSTIVDGASLAALIGSLPVAVIVRKAA